MINLFLTLFISMIFISDLLADLKPDYDYEEIKAFEIEEDDDKGYLVTSEIKVYYHYLTERSTKKNIFFIYQQPFSNISDVSAKLNKHWIKREYINNYYAEFEDVFISDSKIHSIYIDRTINKNSKVFYEYEEEFEELIYFPIQYIPNINRVKNYTLSFEHDDDIFVDFEINFARDSLLYTIDRKDNDLTVIQFENLGSYKELEYYPFNYYLAAIKVNFYKNDKVINPYSPEDFTEWYSNKTNLSPSLDSSAIMLLPDSIKQTKNSITYLRKIYNFVQANIKYLSDERKAHAFIPLDPNTILKQRFGDCKDKSALICALAERAKMNVKMALVNTEDIQEFKSAYLGKFDHMICVLQNEDSLIFMDPAAKFTAFGTIPAYLIGKEVLILDENNPRFEKINLTQDSLSINILISSDIDSLKNSDCEIILRYDYAAAALHAIKILRNEDFENFLVSLINENIYKISIDNFKPIKISDNQVIIKSKADLSRFVISTKNKKYIPQIPFLFYGNSIIKREKDQLPIFIDAPFNIGLQITIIGTNYIIKDSQKILSFDNSIFSVDMQNINNKTRLNYLLQIKERIFSDNKYNFLEFVSKYLKAKRDLLVIQKLN